ncbi:MAG: hypothetical protein ACFFB0_15735 [Promethearchaeota archaeon]
MVIVVSITTFPYSKGKEIAERYIEVSKRIPPNRDLEKPILRMAARVVEDGIETISITEVKEGKYNEFMKHLSKVNMEYFDIEGVKFKIFTYLSGVDAMSLVGMLMPE